MKTKKAAVELSVSTIVVIVLAMTMLILGMVFVRSIMCSGIILTEQISSGVENEIKGLFGVNDYGVKCIGEGGQEIKLGDGGRRQISCVIKPDSTANYELKVKSIKSLKGVATSEVEKWVLDKDWKGSVSPGDNTVVVAVLNVPKKVSATSLKIEVEELNLDTGTKQTHFSYIDVIHAGTVTSAIC